MSLLILRLPSGRWLGYGGEEAADRRHAMPFAAEGTRHLPAGEVEPYLTASDMENQNDLQVQLRVQGVRG